MNTRTGDNMRTEKEIKKQLENAQAHLEKINQDVPVGHGEYRALKRYIQALEWVLGID